VPSFKNCPSAYKERTRNIELHLCGRRKTQHTLIINIFSFILLHKIIRLLAISGHRMNENQSKLVFM
jgi:hypothetical protein